MKKIISLLAVFCMCFSLLPDVSASAASIRLNKTSISLEVGKSTTLKVTGTKSTVKWSSSNKNVATISKNGKVTAKSEGMATITAKVSKKKLYCTVKVKTNFNSKTAINNISSDFYDTGEGVVGILTNNYKLPIKLSATVVYYDTSGQMIGKSTADNSYFEPGKQCALKFIGPYDGDYNNVQYSSFDVSYSAEKPFWDSNLTDLSIESNTGSDNVMVKVTNNGNKKCEFTIVSVVFYKDGNVIGSDYHYMEPVSPGSSSYEQFSFPYDDNYDTIQVDDYKVFINESCG